MAGTVIRDNVHGDITLIDDVAYELINTKEFQRLKRIAQLGGGQHVFVGATHTRFAHCLGVYYLICKFFENENITNVSPFNDEKNRLIVKIAGLLHDIGHGPFSHSFEKMKDHAKNHEHYSMRIITDESTDINKILVKHNLDPKQIADIIEGKHKNNLMNLLVSSQLDADRLDYLMRDSFNAGVSYSKVDVDWIIRHARIQDGKMVFPEKTLYSIEAYLLGRYYMYLQVYEHKTSKAFDVTLNKWFTRFADLKHEGFKFKYNAWYEIIEPLFGDKEIPLSNYLEMDDSTFYEIIKRTAKEEDEILSDLGHRLINRVFLEPKYIEANDAKSLDEKVSKEKELVSSKYDTKYYFEEEKVRKVSLYSSKIKNNKDENIYFVDIEGNIKDILELSSILKDQSNEEKNKKIIFIPKK